MLRHHYRDLSLAIHTTGGSSDPPQKKRDKLKFGAHPIQNKFSSKLTVMSALMSNYINHLKTHCCFSASFSLLTSRPLPRLRLTIFTLFKTLLSAFCHTTHRFSSLQHGCYSSQMAKPHWFVLIVCFPWYCRDLSSHQRKLYAGKTGTGLMYYFRSPTYKKIDSGISWPVFWASLMCPWDIGNGYKIAVTEETTSRLLSEEKERHTIVTNDAWLLFEVGAFPPQKKQELSPDLGKGWAHGFGWIICALELVQKPRPVFQVRHHLW